MVHIHEINPSRFDLPMAGGPVLNLDGLFMKPLPTPTCEGLPDSSVNLQEDHYPEGILDTEVESERNWFVGSIDQGTTSSRFLIFSKEGEIVASHQIEFENLYPQSG